jgi:hypothetical protein
MWFKWRMFFGVKLIGNLLAFAQMSVGISLLWVGLGTTLLIDVFLMEIPMEGSLFYNC